MRVDKKYRKIAAIVTKNGDYGYSRPYLWPSGRLAASDGYVAVEVPASEGQFGHVPVSALKSKEADLPVDSDGPAPEDIFAENAEVSLLQSVQVCLRPDSLRLIAAAFGCGKKDYVTLSFAIRDGAVAAEEVIGVQSSDGACRALMVPVRR